MNVDVKSEHKLFYLKLIGVKMLRISKKLLGMGLVLGNCTTTLSQAVELIEIMLNEFLR
jgi:hypothetical protein